MRVIIIGSKGFIGKHLTEHLKINGHDVWSADVVVDYAAKGRYFLMDASNSDFQNIFQFEKYDVCINCSGAASVPDSIKNPMRDYYLNTVNVFKILSAIEKYQKECKFINLSSAAVYGNPKGLPVPENVKANPLSPYGFHKYQSEQICEEFHRFFNLHTCSLRIFSVYGEGLQKQLFWDAYQKAISQEVLTFYGTGNESRDFIHVSDLVKVIELVAESGTFEAEVINVANGEEVKIKDAIATFLSFFDHKVEFAFSGEVRKGDPRNWKADIRKIKDLGYNQEIPMHVGLNKYYDWVNETIRDI